MDGSGEAYELLLERLFEVLPDIATQIAEEVNRGRLVPATSLPRADMEARAVRMRDFDTNDRVSKNDLASIPYSDDERLAVLVDALIRTAGTMLGTRKAVSELSGASPRNSTVTFVDPTTDADIEVDLAEEISLTSSLEEQVATILTPILRELRGSR